jgi:hypothetical protein
MCPLDSWCLSMSPFTELSLPNLTKNDRFHRSTAAVDGDMVVRRQATPGRLLGCLSDDVARNECCAVHAGGGRVPRTIRAVVAH